MKKLLSVFILLLSLVSGIAQAAVQTIRADVNGMVCAFCAQGIDKKIRALSQTQDVYVNLKRKVVAVQVKEGQTLTEDILRGVIKDAGYDVTHMQTVDQTLQQVKAGIGKEQ